MVPWFRTLHLSHLLSSIISPQELDEAARRRLVKRLYIPLPDRMARRSLVHHLLKYYAHCLSEEQMEWLSDTTEGYSGADVTHLCKEAALNPIRETLHHCNDVTDMLKNVKEENVRPIIISDFQYALTQVRASVTDCDLLGYQEWNRQFGSLG
jgi:SpoVK/Ycf46/Vps4 family AAA+-type ATPase